MRIKEQIKALEKLDNAFTELNNVWHAGINLNDIDAIKKYPFNQSLDDIDVTRFVNSAIKELEREHKKIEMINSELFKGNYVKKLKISDPNLVAIAIGFDSFDKYYVQTTDLCVESYHSEPIANGIDDFQRAVEIANNHAKHYSLSIENWTNSNID